MLTELLQGIDGVETPVVADNNTHVYWKYCLTIDDGKIEGGSPALANLLKEKNIFSAPRYIVKPAFMCQVFQDKNTLGDSQFPFNLAREGAEGRPGRPSEAYASWGCRNGSSRPCWRSRR